MMFFGCIYDLWKNIRKEGKMEVVIPQNLNRPVYRIPNCSRGKQSFVNDNV